MPIVKGMEKDPEGTATVMSLVDKVVDECESMGIRVKVDDRENMRPGAKYFEWERKGAPLRLEVGPRDAAQNVMVVASRLGGEKQTIAVDEVPSHLKQRLDEMQAKLFADASQRLKDRTIDIDTYEDMKSKIANEDLGFFRVYWKADNENEKAIKEDCAATIRCYPLMLRATWRARAFIVESRRRTSRCSRGHSNSCSWAFVLLGGGSAGALADAAPVFWSRRP